MHLIWDDTEMDDIDDDIMNEAYVGNDYNLQTKGSPKTNDSPSTSKTILEKIPTTTTYVERSSEKTKGTRRNPTTTQPTTSMDFSYNILGDFKLDYDVVHDLMKMRENVIVFELCKITQMRERL